MRPIKFRSLEPRLQPRKIRTPVPGWAGDPQPRATGSHVQPWHCTPFSEMARYGIEVFYPYNGEIRVSRRNRAFAFEDDFGPPPDGGRSWPPLRSFGAGFYTFQLLLDVNPGAEFATRTDPHPRYFADPTETMPLAVPALIRNWWPMIYFMVFKAPP